MSKHHRANHTDIATSIAARNNQASHATDAEVADMAAKSLSDDTKRLERHVAASKSLIETANDTQAAVEYLCRNTKQEWLEFDKWLSESIRASRQSRIGLETEMRTLVSAFREILAVASDPRYEQQIARLRELVALCHQLKQLATDGTLEILQNAIIALELKEESRP